MRLSLVGSLNASPEPQIRLHSDASHLTLHDSRPRPPETVLVGVERWCRGGVVRGGQPPQQGNDPCKKGLPSEVKGLGALAGKPECQPPALRAGLANPAPVGWLSTGTSPPHITVSGGYSNLMQVQGAHSSSMGL